MSAATLALDDWLDRAQFLDHESHRIAYWTAGEGRPLLLIHGFPTSSWDWHQVWGALAERRCVIACDMLGFGLSAKPRSGYSIFRQAEIQMALLQELGVTEFDVVAHDYGDTVGQELLARRNEQGAGFGLGRMLLLNGGLFPEQHRLLPIQRLGSSPFGFIVGRLMNRQRFGQSFCRVFGVETQPDEQELDDFWRLIAHNDGHRISHTLMHYIAERRKHRERWVGALQQAAVPLKLVDGGVDPISGRHMYDYFRELVPGAEAVCFDDIGHYPQTEAPDRLLPEIWNFLDP
ncbi:MAG: alpha/beta hydrolase [Gammaproteobacteria bacterium]|jgi:pimeloyl-ACP methyl ester carboxylesterase|nr:alpha/beta hydrolase [Gammaproteobacteria bacterium]